VGKCSCTIRRRSIAGRTKHAANSYFKPFNTLELVCRLKNKMRKEDVVGPMYLISCDGKQGADCDCIYVGEIKMPLSKLFIWSLATYSPRLQPRHCASSDRFKLIHVDRQACWSWVVYPTGSRLRTVEDWRLIAENCQSRVAHAYLWFISAALSPLIRIMNFDGPRNDPWGIAASSHRQAPVSTERMKTSTEQ